MVGVAVHEEGVKVSMFDEITKERMSGEELRSSISSQPAYVALNIRLMNLQS